MSDSKLQDQKILSELKARYFTIGEVAEICELKPHVLRYWEKEFKLLSPSKRRGNRRYYRKEDIRVVFTIRNLLYREGFTIAGARARLPEELKQDGVVSEQLDGEQGNDRTAAALTIQAANSGNTVNLEAHDPVAMTMAHARTVERLASQMSGPIDSAQLSEVRQELQELLSFMRGGDPYRTSV